MGIIKDKRTQGCRPEGRRCVGDCVVEVDGEGDHVEEEAGQGAEQGEGGEEEGGEGTPEKEIKSHTLNLTRKGIEGPSSQGLQQEGEQREED